MHKILFVIPSFKPSAAAMQMQQLALGLPRDRFDLRVCVFDQSETYVAPMHDAGISVEVLGWSRIFDPQPIWQLRRLIDAFRPQVVHAWHGAALRGLSLQKKTFHLLLSLFPGFEEPSAWNLLDRWLLNRVDRFVATSRSEREGLSGVAWDRIAVVPPAVNLPKRVEAAAEHADPTALGLPWNARLLLCLGPLEPHKGFMDALWGFDILRSIIDNLHLVIVGEGAQLERLRDFARDLTAQDVVHFVGYQQDLGPWLRCAELLWAPSRKPGGGGAVLEAMAAGKPVVACRMHPLTELVVDEETGFLVPPGDKAVLTRQARVLLEDKDLRRRLGEAGRRRAEKHFAPEDMVRRYARIYEMREQDW